MTTFARVLSNPDQPDDNTVIEIAQADDVFSLQWTTEAAGWGVVEVTEQTGIPRIGDFYDGEKFVHV